MEINLLLLLMVFLITFLNIFVIITFLKYKFHIYLYIFFVLGFFIYNGIGITYEKVPDKYFFHYSIFLSVFGIVFLLFHFLLEKFNFITTIKLENLFNKYLHNSLSNYITIMYIFTFIFPLIYPEFRLLDLFNPTIKNLTEVLNESLNRNNINILLKINKYIQLLIMPFFYIYLYKFKKKIGLIFFIFMTILYIQFIESGYISRTAMLMYLSIILLFIWRKHSNYRTLIIVLLVLLAPFIVYSANLYTVIRMNKEIININFLEAIIQELKRETSFSIDSGIPIINSGKTANLFKYFKWIITLPIPKVFTGELDVVRINYDISKIVLGIEPGEPGYFVVLPGLLFESIYIYGKYLFWIHSIFIAILLSFISSLVSRINQFVFLQNYLLFLFSFLLNRAGISSILPKVINPFLIFYIVVFFSIVKISSNN